MTNKISHNRYLGMAETIGAFGGFVLLNAAGKITNAVSADKDTRLIPPNFDVRGARVYISFPPSYEVKMGFIKAGIKEIYFSAEVGSVVKINDTRIEGINYDEEIERIKSEL